MSNAVELEKESVPGATTGREPPGAKEQPIEKRHRAQRAPSIIVGVVITAVAGLSIWYLVRPQPLLVQGEVDATRFDIAARVDGRVGEIPVERGQDVAAGAVLVKIDNPERSQRTSRRWPPRSSRKRSSRTSMPARGRRSSPRKRQRSSGRRRAWSWRKKPMTGSANWPNTATRRLRASTRRPIPCTKANAPWIRP